MKNLIKELNAASDAYYNSGKVIMSDTEFDEKLKILENWEKEMGIVFSNSPTQKVGAPVLDSLKKVQHNHPMLSLAKCHTTEEIMKFAKGQELVAMTKLDGLTISLHYKNGKLVSAETRGNGQIGSDVTEHVKQFINVPFSISTSKDYVIDGEAIITKKDFELINSKSEEKFKNPRNLAAGTLAQLDVSFVKQRYLRFVAWDIIEGSLFTYHEHRLEEAKMLGFDVVPYFVLNETNDKKLIEDFNEEIVEAAGYIGYPIDGVVWKYNDIDFGKAQGQTSHHFNNGIAFKFKDEAEYTTLKNIEWTMGKTGVLTPVAIFNTVEIDGTEVSKASLHNISIMEEILGKCPYVEQEISVIKANQIIPQINWADKTRDIDEYVDKLIIPSICPVCGSDTVIVKEKDTKVLVCTNDNCKGKLLGKLCHYVSRNAMDIEGLSEATLDKFIALGWLNSFEDLYLLKFYSNDMASLDGFGEKSTKNILAAIEKSRTTTLARFLNALSIPLIGLSVSKDIAKLCSNDIEVFCTWMTNGESRRLLSMEGFGEAMYASLINWWEKNAISFLSLKNLLSFDTEILSKTENSNISGKTFVITGSLNHFANREELKAKIESMGGKVSGSISKKTTALISNESSNSSKYKKAESLGVSIWTEDYLISILENK